MTTLTLQRVKQTEYATYGRLGAFVTLELPWKNNERNVSCVPAGTYTAERSFSPNHGYTVFKLVDVPQRDDVEIHIGNLPRDSRGCILVGSKFGDVDYSDGRADGKGPGILGSHTAFRAFIAAHPDQRVLITILDVPAVSQPHTGEQT